MPSKLKPLVALLPILFVSNLYADDQTYNLDPIIVTATRIQQPVSETLADVTVIDSRAIHNAGPAATVSDLLAQQPGIEIDRNGGAGSTTGVFIRGSNSDQVLLLVDGQRVGSTSLGQPTWSYIPLQQIDRIEIVRGPASSLYGSDAIGGVIQIFTKKGAEGFHPFAEAGYGTYNTQATTAGFSGAKEGWNYSLRVGEKSSDSFQAITNPKNPSYPYALPARDGYRMRNSSGKLSYAFGPGNEVGVDYLYSGGWNRYDSLNSSYSPNDVFKQKETIYNASVYLRDRFTGAWTSTFRVGQSSDNSRNLDNGLQTSAFHSTQTQYQWQNNLTLPLGNALFGMEHNDQKLVSTDAYVLNQRSIYSFYAGWNGQIGPHLLQFNVRRDDNSQFGNKTTELAAYGYQFSDHWRGNLSWGTAFRAPTFNDLYYPADGYGDVSNPNLKPESSINREAGLHYETETQKASVTYYQNKVRNLIQWVPIDPANPYNGWTPENVGQATLSGWTFEYQAKLGAYKLSGSLDLQDPRDDVRDKILANRARRIGKIEASRDFGNYEVGIEELASGKRYNDAGNTEALGGYALTNLYLDYRIGRDWSMNLRANNIFDKKYVLVRDYATPGANLFVTLRYSPK